VRARFLCSYNSHRNDWKEQGQIVKEHSNRVAALSLAEVGGQIWNDFCATLENYS
jgi:hypothetical protein